jgi:uncharacterized membrane-anchored protein
MKKYKWIIILLNLIGLLLFFNRSLIEKEWIMNKGTLILLELAPKDPRSLMQGDYMALQYKIAAEIDHHSFKKGYCVVRLQPDGIAEWSRFQEYKTPLDSGEYLIKYRKNDYNDLIIGAESFFFQEGEGEKYAVAKYGGIKTDKDGICLLIGLYDETLKKIE